MKKKVLSTMCIILAMTIFLVGCGDPEKKAAKEECENEISRIEKLLLERDELVQKAEEVVQEEKPALNKELVSMLENQISTVKAIAFEEPDITGETKEIKAIAEELKKIDYQKEFSDLKEAQKDLQISRKQYELVNAPEEAFIIERLKRVENMGDISAATEDNDPNGNLNKQGGYTAQVYFSSPLIDQSIFSDDSVIDKGTQCGGSIEVYKTVEEVQNREDYLATFDGGVLSSGSHKVIGTVLIRTSNELTATQQQELEKAIIEAFTMLE